MLTGNTGQITLFISTRNQLLLIRVEVKRIDTACVSGVIMRYSVVMLDASGIKCVDVLLSQLWKEGR